MVTIRIDKIKVNRGGPLNEDFEFEPGNLNLIYGRNETGKTYVVEALISLLFRTDRKAPVEWQLRDWDLAGRIVVSGLEDDPVKFTKTSSKLEDYWEEDRQELPQDLSRLLVVRAGDTSLSQKNGGMSRNILRNYLSGEAIIDKIENRISTVIRGATVEDKSIQGKKSGEIKKHFAAREKLEQLDNLLDDVNRGYVTGAIHSVRKDLENMEQEQEGLMKAKRYYAKTLHVNHQTLEEQNAGLPDEKKCAEIATHIGIYNEKKRNHDSLKEELKPLEASRDNYTWAEKALLNYDRIITRQKLEKPNPIFMILAIISFAGAVISGFIDQKWGLGVGALVTVVFSWLHLSSKSKVKASAAGDSIELKNLKSEFKNRFNKSLTDKAVIQSQLEALKKNQLRAEQMREDLLKLKREMVSVEGGVASSLQEYTNKELTSGDWKEEVQNLRKKRLLKEKKIRYIEKEFASLGIQFDQFLNNDPGIIWDSERYLVLEKKIENIHERLESAKDELYALKSRVAQETNRNSTDSWEDLLTALQDKREKVVREYKEITADILGKIRVFTALEEIREQETERIKKGLRQEALIKPMLSITGRYNRIDLEENDLILSDRGDHSFALADMSTGAREQVFLALRLGFASIGMEGGTAFLILDDAFQHSDWHRRKNLINQTLSLVKCKSQNLTKQIALSV
jgi:hypothetical protein